MESASKKAEQANQEIIEKSMFVDIEFVKDKKPIWVEHHAIIPEHILIEAGKCVVVIGTQSVIQKFT